MLIRMDRKHDIVCWTIAIGLHLLLLLVNFNLSGNIELERLVPIVEVDYISYEDIIPARQVGIPGKPPETFKEKVKHFFSKKVEPAKKGELLAGKAPAKLEADKIRGLSQVSQEKTLVDKKGALSRKVDLSLKNKPEGKSEEKLLYQEESLLVVSQEPKLKDLKLQNLEDKGYKVAKRDLPFEVSARERIRGDEDIVGVDLGKETSEGILTQAPSLGDIEGKASFGEGVFRVVKQEAQGKLSGSEVLVSLLAMAKKEEARRMEEYGGGLSSEGVLTGEEGQEGSAEGSVVGSGRGEGGSSTGTAAKGGYLKEAGSEEEGGKRTFRKGVVFSQAPAKEGESGGSGSRSQESKGVTKKEPRGRVIFEIRGPLSDRIVLYRELPSYPEWAEKEGIEAGVSVHFVVLSDGKVKDNIYVVKTSGYPVLDKLVMEVLRNWKFASLKGDLYGKEEWGVLTFYFSFEGGA